MFALIVANDSHWKENALRNITLCVMQALFRPCQNTQGASYFHKGLMWRGVKVEKSRKNGFSYDKAIFWQNL